MNFEVKFGEWLPDQPDYSNPGLEDAMNCIPSPKGYKPTRGAAGAGLSVTGTIIGAEAFERADGSPVVAVATTSDLWVIAGGIVTASTLSLSLGATVQVEFEQFGANIYASTKSGDTWVLVNLEAGVTFAAAPGSPPNANALGRVGDFLVMGDIVDIDTSNRPYGLRWSAFNNPSESWASSVALQSGSVDLDAQQGRIMAISGGTFGIILQRFGISRFTYTGGSAVFRLELYEKNRGTVAPKSVLRVGDITYFLAFDGFFRTDGSSVQPVSGGRVWEWFLANATQARISDTVGAIDWENRCVVWSFASGDTAARDRQLWFNWETEQWSYVNITTGYLVGAARAGLTLEQVAVLFPDLDLMTVSLDSPEFRAAGRTLAGFVDGEYSTFTGPTLAATFASGDFQPAKGKRSFIRDVTPLIASNDMQATVRVGTRERMTQSVAVSAPVPMGPLGFAPFNSDGRYFRAVIETGAGEEWSDAYGFQVNFDESGDF